MKPPTLRQTFTCTAGTLGDMLFAAVVFIVMAFLLSPGVTLGAESLMGVNVDRPEDTSPAAPTQNAVLTARRFNTPDGKKVASVDAAGWPTADFGVVIHDSVTGISGVYTVDGECRAKPTIGRLFGSDHVVRDLTYAAGEFSATVEFKGGSQVFGLTFTGTSGGVRNLRVMRPNAGMPGQFFTANWLKSKEPFGAVRWMNWTRTNDNPSTGFDDRTRLTDAQWSGPKGGPWEPIFDYAAATGKPAWIPIPHLWDENSIRQLARLAKARAGTAKLTLLVEDTNEYWNYQFQQAKWIDARAKVVALAWKLNDDGDTGRLRHRYHAKRTIDIGRIFREECPGFIIRPILTFQMNAPGDGTVADTHAWIKRQYGNAHGIYADGCAPYFGSNGWSSSWNPQQFADHLLTVAKRYGTPESDTSTGVKKLRALATQFGVKMVTYEGGADLGQGEPVAAKAASQSLATTGQAVGVYLDWWFREGGDEFFYYKDFSAWNRSGVWGLTNQPGKFDGPKYKAAAAAAFAHVRSGTPTPPPVDPPPTTGPSDPPPVVEGETTEQAIRAAGAVIVEIKPDAVYLRAHRTSPVPDKVIRVKDDILVVQP